MLIIRVKATDKFRVGDIINLELANDNLCELASPDGEALCNKVLDIPKYEHFMSPSDINGMENTTIGIEIYPNPASSYVKINYSLINNELVNISLYNSLGEIANNIVSKPEYKGNHTIETNISDLQPGLYYLRMGLINNSVIIRKLVITK